MSTENLSHDTCLLCGQSGTPITLNNLPMYECIPCDLRWRKEFDVDIQHYEEKGIDYTDTKIARRLRNCRERSRLFRKYTSLDNLCDVGCGEGLFLQVLQEEGSKAVLGIEPGDFPKKYLHEDNKPTILKGAVERIDDCLEGKGVTAISMFHLIEHLTAPDKAIALLAKTLPQEGTLIIETPNFNCHSFKKSNYRHKLIYKEHFFYFSKKSLKKLLEQNGFSVFASGNRDFDVVGMPIREALYRLGFISGTNKNHENESMHLREVIESSQGQNSKNLPKMFLQKVLSKLVRIVGLNNDYLWVVAKKS